MRGHLVLIVLLGLLCVHPTYAAGPTDDPVPVPPGMNLSGPALANNPTLMESDPAVSVLPTALHPPHVGSHPGYGAQRKSDDCDCCAEYFGGFGPLWETYCADRQRCWGITAACESSRCYPSFRDCLGCRARPSPLLESCRFPALRARLSGPACRRMPSCSCDDAAPAEMMMPAETATHEIGEPAQPTPAQPEEAVEPEPSPPSDPPAAHEPVVTSSRRGWSPQRTGRLPPR